MRRMWETTTFSFDGKFSLESFENLEIPNSNLTLGLFDRNLLSSERLNQTPSMQRLAMHDEKI